MDGCKGFLIKILLWFICTIYLQFTLFHVAHADSRQETISIAILRSKPLYAEDIERSLRTNLARLGYEEGKNTYYFPTVVVKDNVADFAETAKIVREILKKKPDIFATIGTQASVPTWQILSKTDIPMVFSGVTYPIDGGLIEAYNKPTGKNITGISYAVPTEKRIELIRRMFPDKNKYSKIAFLYSGQVLQDFTYAKRLRLLQGVAGWNILFVDYFDYAQNNPSFKMLLKKLNHHKPDLAFGWYSLNCLRSQSSNFRKFIKEFNKPVLSITSNMDESGAIGGFLTNLAGLGAVQADMINKILKGTFAGDLPPKEPTEYVLELNIKRAQELGITFNPELIKDASKLYQ